MKIPPIIPIALLHLGLISCGDHNNDGGPTITTPAHAKVDLSKVSMKISKAKITRKDENHYTLSFKYTLINKAGATLSFMSIHSGKDELIEVDLSDKKGDPLELGKRPLEGLTLANARPMLIPNGKFSREYSVPIMPELRKKGDPISLRVRLHAPSRYDELRSSVEARITTVPWPKGPKIDTPEKLDTPSEDNPLTSPPPEATYPTR